MHENDATGRENTRARLPDAGPQHVGETRLVPSFTNYPGAAVGLTLNADEANEYLYPASLRESFISGYLRFLFLLHSSNYKFRLAT